MTLIPFDDLILEGMREPEYAVAYLQDALEDTTEDFLRALGKYVKANGGIAHCAEKAGVTREALYRMLSSTGNPEFRSIQAVLKAMGIQLHLSIKQNQNQLEQASA